jgi:hypothetical protein
MRFRISLMFVLSALLLSGCQRLNDERTIKLMAGAIQAIDYGAPRYAQKLTVNVSSPGAPVTVYIVRQEDSEAAQNKLDASKAPSDPLAGQEKAEEINLETTVPPNTAFTLLIRADKKTAEVRLKVTGR